MVVEPLQRTDGEPPRVIVVGGGVAAVETVLALRSLAGMRVGIELIAPDFDMRYPPLEVLEPFGTDPPRIELGPLLHDAGTTFRRDAVASVDADARTVRTRAGATLGYDALVLAVGARRLPSPSGMLSFGDAAHRAALAVLVSEAQIRRVHDIVFAVPSASSWPLPLYELALLTAHRIEAQEDAHTRLTVVTPERSPLQLFGQHPSDTVRERLRERGVELVCDVRVERILEGEVRLAPDGTLRPADRVVTTPALAGPALDGVPHDADGFLPIDTHGAVEGVADVYAAGDATSVPIKQGGVATQLADCVAEVIAARAGAPVRPTPWEPVLRGMLLTGEEPEYLESDRGPAVGGSARPTPLWWPPTKVASRYLAPFLPTAFSGPWTPAS
jgi:sulfide:quinone oxidoreductase